MKCCSKKNRLPVVSAQKKGFTLPEVAAALVILALITSSALVVINRCIKATIDEKVKVQAFEITRENMEKLLANDTIQEMLEQGTSEENPDIQWQNAVEPFYEPITSKMWVRAVCSATYIDTHDEPKTIEFTHWLSDLSKKQILDMIKQKQFNKEEQLAEIGQFLWDYIDSVSEDLLLQLYNQMTGEEKLLTDVEDFEEIKKYILDNLDTIGIADETILMDLHNQAIEMDITEADTAEADTADKQPDRQTKTPEDQKSDQLKKPKTQDTRKKPVPKTKDNLIFGYTENELDTMSFEEIWELFSNLE